MLWLGARLCWSILGFCRGQKLDSKQGDDSGLYVDDGAASVSSSCRCIALALEVVRSSSQQRQFVELARL